MLRSTLKKLLQTVVISAWLVPGMVFAASLTSVKTVPLPDNRVQMILHFSGALHAKPKAFVTKKPPRLILDFKGVSNKLKLPNATQSVQLGVLRQYTVIEAGARTRLILNLSQVVNYKLRKNGNELVISLAGGARRTRKGVRHNRFHSIQRSANMHHISAVDFRGDRKHGGKIVVKVSDANMAVDLKQQGEKIVVDFINTKAPRRLQRRYDVTDFGTPVDSVQLKNQGNLTHLEINNHGEYHHFAYQVNKEFIIEVKRVTEEEKERIKRAKPHYVGKRISLNFQDIKVRAVLQLLADFTGINVVVSDAVKGNITLRLNNVPWDQALDIIMKTRGLAKRQVGNVMLVAPLKEIAARERQELKNKKQVNELAPLHAELIQINYAKALDVANLLKDKNNTLLSPRGTVSVDVRTNNLWVQDSADKLEEIRGLIHKLDIPVKQVLIEARIVIVDKTFERDLGVRFGITSPNHLSGTINGANSIVGGTAPANVSPLNNRLNVDLPAVSESANVAKIGLALAKLGKDILLDLELSALEVEGRGEVISSPRLITANQQAAMIKSGTEIPYQQQTSSGATAIAFKDAVLSLKVTPQITPDHKVILDLTVNQDEPGQVFLNVPAIDTKEIQTKVLVDNGQTIVLGGIYKQTNKNDVNRVPFLGSIPILGALFRNKALTKDREELLIFVTPKIIEQNYVTG